MTRRQLGILLCTLAPAFCCTGVEAWQIVADYPGANIIVERQEENRATLRQDLRDTQGWWFYWNFAVNDAAGETLTFEFSDRNVVGTQGPAFSSDGGQTWSWLGVEKVRTTEGGVRFEHTLGAEDSAVRFAFAPPYQDADLKRFLALHESDPNLSVVPLCTSEKGRTVERIQIGRPDGTPEFRVLLTARHHSCESMASFVLEGMMAALLSNAGDGPWFQENVEALIVPFVDKDGVEDGDQGKNRKPRDHGRDYAGESLYNSTRALRSFVPAWSEGRLVFTLDIHCPHIRGHDNEKIYQVGHEDPELWRAQQRFAQCLESVPDRPLPYLATNDMPFGQSWNKASNYTAGAGIFHWTASLEGVQCATALEVPYANVADSVITPDTARKFGTSLVSALRAFLSAPSP